MNGTPCIYCGRPLLWVGCEYPFQYHEGDTSPHGDWVPEHDCEADAGRATDADRRAGCGDEVKR